ncbi:MAG: hypothetical protein COX70_03330, partial [Flavobacteriales bacterium CG_4_10_14_0_2_um_filter_32_8]
ILTILTILMLTISNSFAQITIERQVIGSTGGFATGTTMSLSSTVGEANIQTLFSTNIILTQGFQQPVTSNNSVVDYEIINESCPGAGNGSIYVSNVLGCPEPYSVIITAVGDSVPLGQDTLSTGNYEVSIIGSNGCSYQLPLFVGLDSDEACELVFYHGITPNGDGKNDAWIIENIELYPENTVQIYNRWGVEVWFQKNYDNDKVVWEGNKGIGKEGIKMDDGTYFYVAIVGGKDYKGWVELTK